MVRFDDLRLLLSCGATDKRTLYHAIQRLPHPSELPADVVDQIGDLVPQISELLSLCTQISSFREYHFDLVPQIDELVADELDPRFWCIETEVCQLLYRNRGLPASGTSRSESTRGGSGTAGAS